MSMNPKGHEGPGKVLTPEDFPVEPILEEAQRLIRNGEHAAAFGRFANELERRPGNDIAMEKVQGVYRTILGEMWQTFKKDVGDEARFAHRIERIADATEDEGAKVLNKLERGKIPLSRPPSSQELQKTIRDSYVEARNDFKYMAALYKKVLPAIEAEIADTVEKMIWGDPAYPVTPQTIKENIVEFLSEAPEIAGELVRAELPKKTP